MFKNSECALQLPKVIFKCLILSGQQPKPSLHINDMTQRREAAPRECFAFLPDE